MKKEISLNLLGMKYLLNKLIKHRLGSIGLLIIIIIIFISIFAPYLTPYSPNEQNLLNILQKPSLQHWCGTDHLGRDIFTRIIFGARISLQVMIISIIFAVVIGLVVGLTSGYFGGIFDEIVMRIMDGIYSFPVLILALAIIAILGTGIVNAMIAIAIVDIPRFARLARGNVLILKEKEFIKAAIAIGCSSKKIIYRHVFPNITGNIIVFATLRGSQALITESSLSFLGLGVQPPTPSWGIMIATGMEYWYHSWWFSFFPGIAIFITVLAFNFLGDGLRDVLDIKLK